jgi:hypothetical protein
MMSPPPRSERRQAKLARRRSETVLGSPLELRIPSPASRQHHPLTPFPFENELFARRRQSAFKEHHQSLASIIAEEPLDSQDATPALESHSDPQGAAVPYDDSMSVSETAVPPAANENDSASVPPVYRLCTSNSTST